MDPVTTIPATSNDDASPRAPDYEKLGFAYGADHARFLIMACGDRAIDLYDDWRAIERLVAVQRLEFLHAAGANFEQLSQFTVAVNAGMKAEFSRDPVLCQLLELFVQPTLH